MGATRWKCHHRHYPHQQQLQKNHRHQIHHPKFHKHRRRHSLAVSLWIIFYPSCIPVTRLWNFATWTLSPPPQHCSYPPRTSPFFPSLPPLPMRLFTLAHLDIDGSAGQPSNNPDNAPFPTHPHFRPFPFDSLNFALLLSRHLLPRTHHVPCTSALRFKWIGTSL